MSPFALRQRFDIREYAQTMANRERVSWCVFRFRNEIMAWRQADLVRFPADKIAISETFTPASTQQQEQK